MATIYQRLRDLAQTTTELLMLKQNVLPLPYVKVLHGHVLKLQSNCMEIDILTICNIMLTAGFCPAFRNV